MRGWLGVLRRTPARDTKKAIETAAIKAEALTIVGEIRSNLDRIEELVTDLPDTHRATGDTVSDA